MPSYRSITVARLSLIIALLALLAFTEGAGQDHLTTLAVTGLFTTSSELYYNIDDPNPFARTQFVSLDNIYGLGFDVRRRIEGTDVELGFNADYITKRESFFDPSSGVTVEDGYDVIPIEATGYFIVPFSSNRVQMYMGGGIGTYIGSRSYRYGSVDARVLSRKPGFGIHVLTGFNYFINPSVALRGELKFRDAQFESTNALPSSGTYQSAQPLTSRIEIDGMTFLVGLAYRF